MQPVGEFVNGRSTAMRALSEQRRRATHLLSDSVEQLTSLWFPLVARNTFGMFNSLAFLDTNQAACAGRGGERILLLCIVAV